MVFLAKKNMDLNGLEESKPWERTRGWTNPFGDQEDPESLHQEQHQPQDDLRTHKQKKSKRSSRSRRHRHSRHHMTEEEYSEMSSKADSMLDDLLGEEDFSGGTMLPRRKEGSSNRHGRRRHGVNPFEEKVQEEDEEEDMGGDEINQEEFSALMRGAIPSGRAVTTPASNPFADDKDDLGDDDDDDVENAEDDIDSSIETPPEDDPFGEDMSVEDSEAVNMEPLMNGGVVQKNSTSAPDNLSRKHTDTTGESDSESPVEDQEEEEEEEEEDVVESSKRLLRMADQRLQYQQYNDEIKKLREYVERMKHQAEAMSEQLRRAVETKCDLVLSQTEMERCHEQNMIAKDDEIKDIKRYTQELVDYQATNDLNFMNEISSLSKRLEEMSATHQKELAAKDAVIADLQAKVLKMEETCTPVRGSSVAPQLTTMSVEAFRARFLMTPEGSARAPIACI